MGVAGAMLIRGVSACKRKPAASTYPIVCLGPHVHMWVASVSSDAACAPSHHSLRAALARGMASDIQFMVCWGSVF